MQNRAQFDDRIRNLITLAREGSGHSRTLLFSHICDLFLQKRPLASRAQARMLGEILKELLDQVSLAKRQEIAQTLVTLTAPPVSLINILCEDVVAVSGPLLEKAILPDDKLIHIIRYGSEAHRIHISRRFGLSPLVRNELDKAIEENRGALNKYSLNELDRRDDSPAPVMDEETTAHILELLRAQKIHQQDPEQPAATESHKAEEPASLSDAPGGDDIPGFFHNSPESFHKNPQSFHKNPQSFHKNTDYKAETEKSPQPASNSIFHQDHSDDFQPGRAANDADLHRDAISSENFIQMPERIIEINDMTSELNDDLWQQAQESRHEANRQHEFVRTVSDWFWEIDRSGAISFLSDEATGIFNRPVSDLIGMDFISLCENRHENSAVGVGETNMTSFDYLFERRTPFRNMPFYLGLSGREEKQLWYLSAVAIFDTYTGRFSGFRGSARREIDADSLPADVTRKDLRPKDLSDDIYEKPSPLTSDMLHQNDSREEMAAELVHNLSHEFRTPLNAIIGFSEMIDQETWGPVNPQYHKNTRNILAASVQLKEAVNDVLDSARLHSGLMQITPESFSLKAAIKDCQDNISAVAKEHNVSLTDNHNNIDVILYNDKQSVELCLTKILSFIIKRALGGEIISPAVLINSSACVRIEIPMLGPRITDKDAENLFMPLTPTYEKHDNSGQHSIKNQPKIADSYGLSIAKDLAKLIGGDISAHCERGHVSHMVLTLSNYEAAP